MKNFTRNIDYARRHILPLARFGIVAAIASLTLVVAACAGSSGSGMPDGLPASTAGLSTTSTEDNGKETMSADTRTGTDKTKTPLNYSGPELKGTGEWFNSEPTTIEQLLSENRVVLVDFWTYTCVNCLRTLPYLRDWHEKYSEKGLTILGVHAPEFDFEKDAGNVKQAVERNDVGWPVVQDNEMLTWRAFNNQYWPAKYLIGVNGKFRYRHFGEGAYVETEREIRAALEDAGYDLSGIEIGGVRDRTVDPAAQSVTRELYLGYGRNYGRSFFGGTGYAGQPKYYEGGDQVMPYSDDLPHEFDKWYLEGLWKNERESIVHARTTQEPEDYIALKFAARSVNVVIDPVRDNEPFEVEITIDDRPLTEQEAGQDVMFDEDGRSILRVEDPRMYRIIELPEWSTRELKLLSASDNFAVYAFTFGIYTEGA